MKRHRYFVPEMDRTSGFLTSETKTPTSDGWRFVNDVLGGPGRNRTTDTRIFNPLRFQLRAASPRFTRNGEVWIAYTEPTPRRAQDVHAALFMVNSRQGEAAS
jgi:hypothetical protein